jgi:CheY-like chemotaxis protein
MDYSPEVIVVEDNLSVLEALVEHLQSEGFRVRGVETGHALDVALAERPADALVMDLNLPFEDGISITKSVRQKLPGIGILILSARVHAQDRLWQLETHRRIGAGRTAEAFGPAALEAEVVYSLRVPARRGCALAEVKRLAVVPDADEGGLAGLALTAGGAERAEAGRAGPH